MLRNIVSPALINCEDDVVRLGRKKTLIALPLVAKVAVAATAASGLRSIYGFCFTGRVDAWAPFALNPSFIAPFAIDGLRDLASNDRLGHGRVTLGVAFDGWFLSNDMIKDLFRQVKEMGVMHITTHYSPSPPGAFSLSSCTARKQDSYY